jgi:hypothetical protein
MEASRTSSFSNENECKGDGEPSGEEPKAGESGPED